MHSRLKTQPSNHVDVPGTKTVIITDYYSPINSLNYQVTFGMRAVTIRPLWASGRPAPILIVDTLHISYYCKIESVSKNFCTLESSVGIENAFFTIFLKVFQPLGFYQASFAQYQKRSCNLYTNLCNKTKHLQ